MRFPLAEDWYFQNRRWWVRLHEKGGKRHEMLAHHNLEEYMNAYVHAAGIEKAKGTPLFRARGKTQQLTDRRMSQQINCLLSTAVGALEYNVTLTASIWHRSRRQFGVSPLAVSREATP